MDGPKVSTDFYKKCGLTVLTGTKGFKHVKQSSVMIGNFQKDLLKLSKQSTLTFKSDKGLKVEKDVYFMIDTYGDLAGHKKGLLVAISCGIGRRKFILCVENNSIILTEGELPEEILSKNTKFIFYQKNSGSEDEITYANFESSVKRGVFLACSEDGRNLILKPYAEDEVDKTTFSLEAFFQTTDFKQQELAEKIPYSIRNSHEDYLVAHPKESYASFESEGNAKGEHATFYMNFYKDSSIGNGLPVIFSCKMDNKNYLLCVASNSVIIKESELPKAIPMQTSEYIFYVKEFSAGHDTYLFESSLKFEQTLCLAWNKEEAKKTLILKPYHKGSINEAMNFYMEKKDNTSDSPPV